MGRRTLPGTIYYCLSGHISIWLISIYGSTTSIAEVGALGRLAAILMVLGAVFSTMVTPRFARLPEDRSQLLRGYLQICGVIGAIVIVIPGLVRLFPEQVLWILGRNYANLTNEVVLSALGSCLVMMAGQMYTLSLTRLWVLPPWINISMSFLAQAVLILVLDLSSTMNVLWYAVLNGIWHVFLQAAYFIYRVTHLKTQEEGDGDAPSA